MISHAGLSEAVIATDEGLGISELLRHGLGLDSAFKAGKLPFHVDNGATADRATVGGVHVLVIAAVMDAVATAHEDDGLRRGEHVFTTNRTVAIGGALDAAMSITDGNRHANATGL